jgi:surfeit locus 1 family protein
VKRTGPVFHGLTLVAFLILVGLGTWQLRRLAWKEGLIAQIALQERSPPVRFSEAIARNADPQVLEFTPVTVEGPAIGRPLFVYGTEDGGGIKRVFRLRQMDEKSAVWVEESRIAYSADDVRTPIPESSFPLNGELEGVLRRAPSQTFVSTPPDPESGGAAEVDLKGFAALQPDEAIRAKALAQTDWWIALRELPDAKGNLKP